MRPISNAPLRIGNRRYGPFWWRRSTVGTIISIFGSNKRVKKPFRHRGSLKFVIHFLNKDILFNISLKCLKF